MSFDSIEMGYLLAPDALYAECFDGDHAVNDRRTDDIATEDERNDEIALGIRTSRQNFFCSRIGNNARIDVYIISTIAKHPLDIFIKGQHRYRVFHSTDDGSTPARMPTMI